SGIGRAPGAVDSADERGSRAGVAAGVCAGGDPEGGPPGALRVDRAAVPGGPREGGAGRRLRVPLRRGRVRGCRAVRRERAALLPVPHLQARSAARRRAALAAADGPGGHAGVPGRGAAAVAGARDAASTATWVAGRSRKPPYRHARYSRLNWSCARAARGAPSACGVPAVSQATSAATASTAWT